MDQFQDKEVETIISDIQCSSERLIEIVNIFLDVSRLEQGKIVFVNEEFDVVALCRDIVQEYTASGVNKELYLRVLPPFAPVALVRADRNRIRQVIINLIGNPIWAFLRVFIRKGALDGHRSYVVAVFEFMQTFLKYAFLLEMEMQKKKPDRDRDEPPAQRSA